MEWRVEVVAVTASNRWVALVSIGDDYSFPVGSEQREKKMAEWWKGYVEKLLCKIASGEAVEKGSGEVQNREQAFKPEDDQ